MIKIKGYSINEYFVLIYRFLVLLVFYSVCRIGFYFFNQDLFPNVTFPGFLTIMKGGVLFDISGILYLNVLMFFLYLVPFKFKFNKWYQGPTDFLFFLVNSIGFAVNISDFIYYKFTLKRTTFSVFDIFANEDNMGRLWIRFIYDYWYAFLFWLLLTVTFYYLVKKIKPKHMPIKPAWIYTISGSVILGLFGALAVVGIRGGYRHSTRPITMGNAGKYVNAPEEMALVLNTPFSMLRTIGKTTFTPKHYYTDYETLNSIYSPVHERKDNREFKNLNVVIIILESFSREHSGALNPTLHNGNYKGYTPFLDSLVNHSFTFTNAFANGRKSIDALPSILASLPALVQPFVVSEYSSNRISGMGELLRQKGYHTSFFHGAPNGSMGFEAFTRMAGFDYYYGKDEYGKSEDFDGIWGIWDEQFFQFFAGKINDFKQPFVTSVFSVSSHHPFKVPAKYEGVFPKGTQLLHQCIGYSDMALRKFFETASKSEWFNNTLFVITADHSITAYHNEYKTNYNAFAVPLLFYAPGHNLKGKSHKLAQQTDIMPTVLNFLGFNDPYIAFGSDLLNNTSEGNEYVLNYINESYQFLMNNWAIYFDGKDVIAFYNYKDDPLLTNNLKGKTEVPQKELDLLKAVIQQYNNRMINNELALSPQ